MKNREMYALLHAPLAKYKVDAEDADTDKRMATRQFVNKRQMQMTGLHQRSSTEVVSYLMGWNDNDNYMHSYTSYHLLAKFWSVRSHMAFSGLTEELWVRFLESTFLSLAFHMESADGIESGSIEHQLDRTVIVVGPTGVGKSTILNMLYNESYDEDSCKKPAMVGSGGDSTTKKTEFHVSLKAKTVLIDTIGFGDPSLTNEEVFRITRQFLKSSQKGVNCVIVVCKYGRLSGPDRVNVEIFDRLFDPRWMKQSILILTHCGKKLSTDQERAKAIEDWVRKSDGTEDQFIVGFMKKFSKIVLTDNNIEREEEATRPLRKYCLDAMKSSILSFEETFGPKPQSFMELLRYIFEAYFAHVLGKANSAAERAISELQAFSDFVDVSIFAGECPICLDYILIKSLCKTNCDHAFHSNCIRETIKQRQRNSPARCPICRTAITRLFSFEPQVTNSP